MAAGELDGEEDGHADNEDYDVAGDGHGAFGYFVVLVGGALVCGRVSKGAMQGMV